MISLLFGIGYGELTWFAVKRGKYSIKSAKSFVWFMVVVNFGLAMIAHSIVSLEISIILMCYALVIFNIREVKK